MNYEIYSAVAFTEDKNQKEFKETLNKIDCFDKFKSANEAKDYLFNTYGIVGNVNKYTAWRDCFLTTENKEKFLLVKIESQSETKLYYYNK